jgi:hypothetical protein
LLLLPCLFPAINILVSFPYLFFFFFSFFFFPY